ncbi:MAG: TldD/PmbA family protein [Candidatus Thorarchaeota archaeon]
MVNKLDNDIFENIFDFVQKKHEISYFDIKFLRRSYQSLMVKNDVVEENNFSRNMGIGVRVLSQDAWGFAATNNLSSKKELLAIVDQAVRIAQASSKTAKKPVTLTNENVNIDSYTTPYQIDPEKIELEEKISFLIDCTKNSALNDSRIKVRTANLTSWKDFMMFWNSEGSRIEQEIIVTGAGVSTVAVDKGEAITRSLPASFRGDYATAGYEFVKEMDLINCAKQSAQQSLQILEAEKCPQTETSVILLPSQLMLQVHESCGHPTELDRALDYEAAFAGTSFLKPHLLKEEFYYGNENVTMTQDATVPRGLGTFGYDHEGVKAQRKLLVDKGRFVGYLSSRETAMQIGENHSSGSMRADFWNHIPIIRMTNVSLEPGDWDYDEIVQDTKEGIIMDTNKSWSIDDLRLNFQFSTEIGWLIKNGEITKTIKTPSYYGITPRFWGSCSGVTKQKYWKIMGTPNCGKGEPSQIMYTGHGSAPARFENVKIGIVRL